MTIIWFDVLKTLYENGELVKENKTAEQRLIDAVTKGLISEEERLQIVGTPE